MAIEVDEAALKTRTKEFAHRCVKLSMALPDSYLGNHINAQLIRCSTSVAANCRAVCIAQSKADFISKMSIVIEEVDESHFWLEFIIDESLMERRLVEPLLREANELTAIFIASRKTARGDGRLTIERENCQSKIFNRQYKGVIIMEKGFFRKMLGAVFSVVLLLYCSAVCAENIDPDNDGSQYAYGENVGWLNLEPGGDGGSGVEVSDSTVTGYMWGENIGWINLSPTESGVVNDGAGDLSGYAWGENVGWINFAPAGGGVYIDACGGFNGTAWGENIGWISFRSDGDNPFYVRTLWVSPIDTIAPVTEPDSPLLEWHNSDVSITLSATDCGYGVTEVHYIVDGGSEVVTSGSTATLGITTEGVYTLTYWSVDQDGNIESFNEVTFGVDKTPPAITIASPSDGAAYSINQHLLADYTVTDSGSGVLFTTAPVPEGDPIDTSAEGSCTFTVSATDLAGNSNSVAHAFTIAYPGNIDPANDGSRYAYAENVGWINFKPSFGPGVTVADTEVTGYAWGENVGWINLSPTQGGGVVNDGCGNLSGHAWGENVGWINFAPSGGDVTINPATGEFSGLAWGENIGWINFAPSGVGIRTSWRGAPGCTGISLTDLGTLGGDKSSASGINESGDIVGRSKIGSGEFHAFLIRPADSDGDGKPDWYSATTDGINDLMIDLGTIGGNLSFATDINNSAQVVGMSTNAQGSSHAFFWEDLNSNGQSDDGEMIDLGTLPGGDDSIAYCINDLGQIVGGSKTASNEYHAFVLTPEDSDSNGVPDTWYRDTDLADGANDLMVDLGTLGGDYSEALGINNLGQVVGISKTASNEYRAFVLTPEDSDSNGVPDTWYRDTDPADGANDLMVDLGTVSLPDSAAQAVNDLSQVVGWTRSLDLTEITPFLWTVESGMRDTEILGGLVTVPYDINDLGHVVGYSDVQDSSETHAYVWTETGGMIDLGGLGGSNSSASEIDEIGKHIAGSAETPEGKRHAVLWTIIPNTPDGANTEVQIGDVTVTFDNVQTAGFTVVTESANNPGFSLGAGYGFFGPFYKVTTTAIFSGNVTVCLTYPEPDPPIDESQLTLWHCKDGSCVEVDPTAHNPDENTICGQISSFSWFVLGVPVLVTEPVGLQPPLAALALEGGEPPCPDKAFKQGRTLPLRFQLFSQEGLLLTDADVETAPMIVKVTRKGDAPLDLETIDLDAGEANDSGPYFRFSEDTWVYNLSTKDLITGTYSITLEMPDDRRFVTGFVLK